MRAVVLVGLGLATTGCEDWQTARELVAQEPAGGSAIECVVSTPHGEAAAATSGENMTHIRLDPCDPSLAGASSAGTILFASSSAALDVAARDTISDLAAGLQARPGASVAIIGHTDSLGPADQNLAVSQRRAEAVRDALVAAGIDAARIVHVEGRGETDPATPTPDGVASRENRRVQVLLL